MLFHYLHLHSLCSAWGIVEGDEVCVCVCVFMCVRACVRVFALVHGHSSIHMKVSVIMVCRNDINVGNHPANLLHWLVSHSDSVMVNLVYQLHTTITHAVSQWLEGIQSGSNWKRWGETLFPHGKDMGISVTQKGIDRISQQPKPPYTHYWLCGLDWRLHWHPERFTHSVRV